MPRTPLEELTCRYSAPQIPKLCLERRGEGSDGEGEKGKWKGGVGKVRKRGMGREGEGRGRGGRAPQNPSSATFVIKFYNRP